MTEHFDRLQEAPRTDIQRGNLSPDERSQLRTISVEGRTKGHAGQPSGFTTVYYLEGDEEAAAKVFAEVNRDQLHQLNLSGGNNLLASSVPRELYDLILDKAGIRPRTLYPTVVREERPDGTQWLIERHTYHENPPARYRIQSTRTTAKVPPEVSLDHVYGCFGNVITATDISETAIEGAPTQVLAFYCDAEEYACTATTTEDGEPAIHKEEPISDSCE